MTPAEKAKFNIEKLGAAGLMVGVALLSMMKKPSLQMFQFNKLLPSMDQCRLIATATFASRMLVSEDKNELREVTFRDIATFCALYFFGDYVSKGIASGMKAASKVDLLNYTTEEAKPSNNALKNVWNKFKYWVTDTKLKTFDEAAAMGEATKIGKTNAKNMRAICEIGSLGFSMLLLGILVPWYVRKRTENNEKKRASSAINRYHAHPSILYNYNYNGHNKKAFQAFGMMIENNPKAKHDND